MYGVREDRRDDVSETHFTSLGEIFAIAIVRLSCTPSLEYGWRNDWGLAGIESTWGKRGYQILSNCVYGVTEHRRDDVS